MNLIIDNRNVEPRSGQSLLEIVRDMGLVTDRLSTNPLAARIAGEVFTLNYIPVREKDAANTKTRSAVAASGGEVKLLLEDVERFEQDDSGLIYAVAGDDYYVARGAKLIQLEVKTMD